MPLTSMPNPDVTSYALLLAYNLVTFFCLYYYLGKVNVVRDAIILGVLGEVNLSLEHRWLMLRNDWVLAKFGLALFGAALAFFGASYVSEMDLSAQASFAWKLSSIIPATGVAAFLFLGFSDLLFMVSTLRAAKTAR